MTKIRLNGCAWVLLFQCLILTLPVLKLLRFPGVVDWPWLWITVPLWGPGALLAVVVAVEWVGELGRPKAENQQTEDN